MGQRAYIGIGVAVALLAGCARLAVWSAPAKAPSLERTAAARSADDLFWRTLHGGDYDKTPAALTALQAAYLDSPNDAVTAAHIGWVHVWRLGERARLDPVPPGIPGEARYQGFYAATLLAEAEIHQDEKLRRQGYYTLLDAVAAFPEFNDFTAGYVMSGRPYDSDRFKEGLDDQWRNLDVCVGGTVDRRHPDYAQYMRLETREGPKRVCWNSWIAPHNFEGFFLNFGDMLVKAGEPEIAVTMYANARLTPDYAQWQYRDVLEDRVRNAAAYVAAFRQEKPAPCAPRIMGQSRFACMACHQN